ncbi:MAG: DUF3179 domain-containing protein, partial [Anaerolineae bacterium]|nr:DUF3179 domain-containing protein [Anaerolineae bacterium]
TWCPLCFSAITFNRVLDRELTFGASGYLFRNNLVMYDHQTNTLWSQLLGEALRGAYDRERLEVLPSVLTSWGLWKQSHPDTLVLSAERLGLFADEVVDPYAGYYTSGASGLGGADEADERLSGKSLVAGLRVGKTARVYPLAVVKEQGVINDQIENLPLLLVYNGAFENVFAFDRRLLGQTLTFDETGEPGVLRDRETGTTWDVNTGRALEGELAGQRLMRLSAPLVFWFAWADLHPGSEIYSP